MRKSKLFEIKHGGELRFTDLGLYNMTLRNILSNVETIPLVLGSSHWKMEDLELVTLPPKTDVDRINVLTYCTGLSQLESTSGFKKTDFKASIDLGVESRTRIHMGDAILTTGFDLEGVSYKLTFHCERDPDRNGVYTAETRVFVPRSYQVMRKFIGPQFEDY